jgi:hypothetical protein
MALVDRVAELSAEQWWMIGLLLVASRGPRWVREWLGALQAKREWRASASSKEMPQ